MPKKGAKLSEVDKEIIYLQIEKSRVSREKAAIVLNKALFLYFGFLAVGVAGFVFGHFDNSILNLLVVLGIVILIIGSLPYIIIAHEEEKRIDRMLAQLLGGRKK